MGAVEPHFTIVTIVTDRFMRPVIFMPLCLHRLFSGGGEYSHVAYGDVPPKRVDFHQKSLDMCPILVKKKSFEEGPIAQK